MNRRLPAWICVALLLSIGVFLCGCGEVAPTVTPVPPEPTADPSTTPVSVRLLAKKCEACFGSPHNFEFTYELANNTGKDIGTFTANVFFSDGQGNRLKAAQLFYDAGMGPGEKKRFVHFLEYRHFSKTDPILRDLPSEGVRVSFEMKEITFRDGTSQQYP